MTSISFHLLATCALIREANNSKSLTSLDFNNNKFGVSVDISKDLRVGVLLENSKLNDEEKQYSAAAEYDVDDRNKVKARIDNYGIFGFFYRTIINNNLKAEANFKSGLNPQHKINGTLGNNFQIGLKLLYSD